MSLQPLDLQTLFSRMNQIGRDQAAMKNAEVHSQEAAGREIEQKTAQKSHSVQQSEEIQDGPEKVHDDDEAKNEHRQGFQKRQTKEDEDEQKAALKDPDLGQNIDFTG
ncbi:hypothetical protein [Spirochaeta dissipatitropha]